MNYRKEHGLLAFHVEQKSKPAKLTKAYNYISMIDSRCPQIFSIDLRIYIFLNSSYAVTLNKLYMYPLSLNYLLISF